MPRKCLVGIMVTLSVAGCATQNPTSLVSAQGDRQMLANETQTVPLNQMERIRQDYMRRNINPRALQENLPQRLDANVAGQYLTTIDNARIAELPNVSNIALQQNVAMPYSYAGCGYQNYFYPYGAAYNAGYSPYAYRPLYYYPYSGGYFPYYYYSGAYYPYYYSYGSSYYYPYFYNTGAYYRPYYFYGLNNWWGSGYLGTGYWNRWGNYGWMGARGYGGHHGGHRR